MAENFERIVKKEWYREDLKVLTSQLKEQDSLLRLKRRWLLDLPLAVSEQKRVNEILPPNDKSLPESLLREDDVIYEHIRTCIETGFGAHNRGMEHHCLQEDVHVFSLRDLFKDISLLLDEMNNKGLCSFIKILTGGTIKFEKTNWSMKRTIKDFLRNVLTEKGDISKPKLKQISQLLKDPQNFRGNQMVWSTASEAYRAAAVKILEGLEDFPSRSLIAMARKLRGVKDYMPTLRSTKCGKARDILIGRVKKLCMEMLEDLGEMCEPAEALTGALGVACLTLKFILDRSDVRDLRKFSPEMEVLQNDIAKAIHLLTDSKRVSLIELRKVQLLLDPNTELSVRSLRTAVRNFLTEFLFECSDIEKVPDFLIETLDIINRRPQAKKHSSSEAHSSQESGKDVLEKEMECVLAVSAQAKEVLLELLPEHDFDEDFAHAYMENFEGSDYTLSLCDNGDEEVEDISEHYEYNSENSHGQTESVGETHPVEFNSPVSREKDGCASFVSPNGSLNENMDSNETCGSVHSPYYKESKILDSQCTEKKKSSHSAVKNEETNLVGQEGNSGNHYLDIQQACDVTSMVAYHYVGRMLNKLAKDEGIVLCQGDRLYLQGHNSGPENSEESPNTFKLSNFPVTWKDVLER